MGADTGRHPGGDCHAGVWAAARGELDRDAAASGPLDLLLLGGGTPMAGIVAVLLGVLAVVPWAVIGVAISVADFVTRPARRRLRRGVR